jgi:hypothetical protein
MKHLFSVTLLTFALGITATFGQSTPSETADIRSSYEAQGINFDQVQSMIETVTNYALEPNEAVMADFLRTIATFQAAGAPVPMTEEWLTNWTTAHSITNEQAQDLYKVALRFGLQRR